VAHEAQPTIGKKVWDAKYAGPDGAFAEGRAKYRLLPATPSDRIAWASTLYSELTRRLLEAKKGDLYALLLAVRNGIMLWSQVWFFKVRRDFPATYREQLGPDGCETISAILNMWSKIPIIGGNHYKMSAIVYVTAAYNAPITEGGHTHAHACITRAGILRGENGYNYLLEALQCVGAITDRNQRARVYRGAARLYKNVYLDSVTALLLIKEAMAIPDLSEDVIYKNQETYDAIMCS
jgi:hypothetical protein